MPVVPEELLELDELELELDELLELEDELTPATARRYLATLVVQVPVHLVPVGGIAAILLSKLPAKNFTLMPISPSIPFVPWQLLQRAHSDGATIAVPEDEDDDEDEEELELDDELVRPEELLELEELLDEELLLEEELEDEEVLEVELLDELDVSVPVPPQAVTATDMTQAENSLAIELLSRIFKSEVKNHWVRFSVWTNPLNI